MKVRGLETNRAGWQRQFGNASLLNTHGRAYSTPGRLKKQTSRLCLYRDQRRNNLKSLRVLPLLERLHNAYSNHFCRNCIVLEAQVGVQDDI